MMRRPIPSTGEMLPVVGCGTWQTFDVGTSGVEREPLGQVLQALVAGGGSLVDSSPMYGRAEAVAGDLVGKLGIRHRTFLATKVWTRGRDAGIAQLARSQSLLGGGQPLDLVQIHNLVDWRTHLPVLRDWKASGRIRYIGITHYTSGAHAELSAVMQSEDIDFVQVNYSLSDRAAEQSLLPLAAARGIAVLVNRPLGEGQLVSRLRRLPLPDFAAELGCGSWPELALKYLLGHEAVSSVIPATRNPEHMASNARAGTGALPDADLRRRILQSAGL